jgi:hypothetical protein
VLGAVALIVGAVVAASMPDPEGDSAPAAPNESEALRTRTTPTEDPSTLTAREARTIFTGVRRRLEEAYRRRSIDLLEEVAGPGSPQLARGRRDLRLLERNDLLDRTRIRSLQVTLVSIAPGRLVVRERAEVRPRFVDEATHVELDAGLARRVSISEWVLERQGAAWMIISSRTVD